jgi:hypothetical protein
LSVVVWETGDSENGCPLSHGGERALEADCRDGHTVDACGLGDESADEVVSDDMHPELFFDHVRALAAQDIESHGDFDITEADLGHPTLSVELAEGVLWEEFVAE